MFNKLASANGAVCTSQRSFQMTSSSVLCVGLVCVDNVVTVKQYPEEDSDLPGLGEAQSTIKIFTIYL